MSYINEVTGSLGIGTTIGTIENISVEGYTTTIFAIGAIKKHNVIGKLGIATMIESDHNKLKNRDLPDQHPIEAITGLKKELDNAGKVKDILVNGESVVNEQGKANIDTSEFTTKYTATDNVMIEDNTIKVFTNTGYKVNDKYIQLQRISELDSTGQNKIVYTDEEIMFISDGSNKLRKFENGIDDKIIEMPKQCIDLIYLPGIKRLMALSNDGNFFYSDDLGESWTVRQHSAAEGASYIFRNSNTTGNFISVNVSTKTIYRLTESFGSSGTIESTNTPNFIEKANNSWNIWCDYTGTFKYYNNFQEGNFVSLSDVTVSFLKTINNKTIVGLKNNNKIYLLKTAPTVANYTWVEHTLPDICTVNDIVHNPYDDTYYIFTSVNTYYKTKDFLEFESVDKNGLRGLQGDFTLMGIQMTTTDNNRLLLAPTRTKQENKNQEFDRALNKDMWVGPGLQRVGEEQIGVKVMAPLSIHSNGIRLLTINEGFLSMDIVESLYVAKAEIKVDFDPYEFENWYWEEGIPEESTYKAVKFVFNQDGSFFDQVTYEEIFVEENEYGYVFYDSNLSIFKYVKLGNLGRVLN